MLNKNREFPIYGIVVWIISVLFYFYEFVLQISPGVLIGPLQKEFNLSAIAISQIGAIYYYTYASMQIPAGMLLDKLGPRKILSIAALLCFLGTMLLSYAHTFYFVLGGRFLTALGSAFAMIGSMKIIASWFSKQHFALLSGLILLVGMSGAVFAKAPLSFAVNIVGWRDTLFYLSIAGLIIFLLILFIVRDHPKQYYESLKGQKSSALSLAKFSQVFKSKQTWYATIYAGLLITPVLSMGALWGEQYLQHAYNFSQIEAAARIAFIFIGMGIGGPVSGWLSDHINSRKKTMMIAPIGSFFCLMPYIYISHQSAWYYDTLGFLLGIFISFSWTAFSFVRELHTQEDSATAVAFVNFGSMLLGAVSQTLVGVLLTWAWVGTMANNIKVYTETNYELAFIIFPIFTVIGFLISCFLIKETRRT